MSKRQIGIIQRFPRCDLVVLYKQSQIQGDLPTMSRDVHSQDYLETRGVGERGNKFK